MNPSIALPVPAPASPRPARRLIPFIPFRRVPLRTVIWSGLLGLALVAPLTILVGLLPLPASPAEVARPQRFLEYMLHPGALFLKAVILAPLLEELFYRGLLLQLARRYLRAGTALALSTAVFVLPHLSEGLGTALFSLAMGLVLGGLLIRTGSLIPGMLCHAVVNLSWLFVLGPTFGITEKIINYVPGASRLSPLLDAYPAWWIATSIALLVASIVMLRRPPPAPAA